ncbi:MAG: AraC family transcriptional regulator, partial [Verrucomicrobiae bacterium]|nr:AraC family transcriptional regulator [Verrucomicrobiae bacterium]NNJ86396.1 helix-turn-helix transcriptional regulator [Akkermansiaceae bacterium]
LADIAITCGFCDQSYFTNVFQDVKGITPKQFRTALLNQPAT